MSPRLIISFLAALACAAAVQAEPLKALASVQGVRDNPLVGYGLVVGLDGSGDQTQQTPFTAQSVTNMLTQLGITVPAGTGQMQLKNVAAVMVTATLPPFAAPGQAIDVTVSSVGNAKSLRGGTLLMTPLKGADGSVYAVAQGNLVIGGAGAAAGGSSVQVNQLSAGRIPGGATVERGLGTAAVPQGNVLTLELRTADFGTAQRAVEAIDRAFGPGSAAAQDARVVHVRVPPSAGSPVAFLARLEAVDVMPAPQVAKVIVNARTGSVVMNQAVRVEDCAVAHGSLSVVVSSQPQALPPARPGGRPGVARNTQIALQQEGGALQTVRAGASLASVIQGINALGATPQDLVSILQAMKAAGALRAELEVI